MFAIFAKTAGGVEWWVARKSYGTSLSMIPTDYYINRANAERSKLVIMSSAFAGGAWQPAAPLPFSTGAFRDVDPFVVHLNKLAPMIDALAKA